MRRCHSRLFLFHSSFAICLSVFGLVSCGFVDRASLLRKRTIREATRKQTRIKSGKKREMNHSPIENGTLTAGCFCAVARAILTTRIDRPWCRAENQSPSCRPTQPRRRQLLQVPIGPSRPSDILEHGKFCGWPTFSAPGQAAAQSTQPISIPSFWATASAFSHDGQAASARAFPGIAQFQPAWPAVSALIGL